MKLHYYCLWQPIENMACEDDVKDIFQSADCVCFDVDCTVCTDETIDELAKTLGMGDEVSKM